MPAPGTTALITGTRALVSGATGFLGGLDLGDVVVEVAGRPVRSADDLVLALERHKAGETVAVKLLRDGRTREVQVRLSTPARRR